MALHWICPPIEVRLEDDGVRVDLNTGNTLAVPVPGGPPGRPGDPGPVGPGIPPGGTPGQYLRKASAADYDGEWGGLPAPPVQSVNGKTGAVGLNAEDVGALPDTTPLFSGSYNDLTDKPSIPSPQTSGTPADLGTAAQGSETTFSRSDHVHAMPPYGAQNNITSGTHDLDDYKTAGVYYFSTGATLSNVPNSASDGWLTVYQSSEDGACKQVWQREGSNPKNFKDFYMRLYYESAWGDWFAITDGNGVIRYKDFSFGISFSSGTAGTFAGVKDFDIALSGWTPIGICMYKATSAGTILCYPMINISSNNARLAYGRWATGAYNETVTVRVAYVKS